MPTLFLDIDNTLIYSHRWLMTVPNHAVEVLNGKNQSFITQRTYSFFSERTDLQIVPVTTRSFSQFQRLADLMSILRCEHSLICNGAILLHNMEMDKIWYEETLTLAGQELAEISKAEKWFKANCGETSTHSENGVLVYAKSSNAEAVASALRQYVDVEKVDILLDHSKIYCIPKALNKGTAIYRFSKRFNVPDSIAAGDSDFDIPMLNQANLAIAPEALRDKLANKNTIFVDETGWFSDEICSELSKILSS